VQPANSVTHVPADASVSNVVNVAPLAVIVNAATSHSISATAAPAIRKQSAALKRKFAATSGATTSVTAHVTKAATKAAPTAVATSTAVHDTAAMQHQTPVASQVPIINEVSNVQKCRTTSAAAASTALQLSKGAQPSIKRTNFTTASPTDEVTQLLALKLSSNVQSDSTLAAAVTGAATAAASIGAVEDHGTLDELPGGLSRGSPRQQANMEKTKDVGAASPPAPVSDATAVVEASSSPMDQQDHTDASDVLRWKLGTGLLPLALT
jgi:hypothetical protein